MNTISSSVVHLSSPLPLPLSEVPLPSVVVPSEVPFVVPSEVPLPSVVVPLPLPLPLPLPSPLPSPLPLPWTVYHHDPENKDWGMSGYDVVFPGISNAEEANTLCNKMSDDAIKHTMWFMMRDPVTPRWEDPANADGGYYQYRVANKYAADVWRMLFLKCCSEELIANNTVMVNGITISPRKFFCTIKIWLNKKVEESAIFPIPNLTHYAPPEYVPTSSL